MPRKKKESTRNSNFLEEEIKLLINLQTSFKASGKFSQGKKTNVVWDEIADEFSAMLSPDEFRSQRTGAELKVKWLNLQYQYRKELSTLASGSSPSTWTHFDSMHSTEGQKAYYRKGDADDSLLKDIMDDDDDDDMQYVIDAGSSDEPTMESVPCDPPQIVEGTRNLGVPYQEDDASSDDDEELRIAKAMSLSEVYKQPSKTTHSKSANEASSSSTNSTNTRKPMNLNGNKNIKGEQGESSTNKKAVPKKKQEIRNTRRPSATESLNMLQKMLKNDDEILLLEKERRVEEKEKSRAEIDMMNNASNFLDTLTNIMKKQAPAHTDQSSSTTCTTIPTVSSLANLNSIPGLTQKIMLGVNKIKKQQTTINTNLQTSSTDCPGQVKNMIFGNQNVRLGVAKTVNSNLTSTIARPVVSNVPVMHGQQLGQLPNNQVFRIPSNMVGSKFIKLVCSPLPGCSSSPSDTNGES